MKNLIIIGAGGMGKEVFHLAKSCPGYNVDYNIKGFLDFPNDRWNTSVYPPIIGLEDEYVIQPNDVFTCSIGDVGLKKKVCSKIIDKGGVFITLIHPSVDIGENVKIGEGCIIDRQAIIGSDVTIGKYNLIQLQAIVGHDVTIGDWNRIDCKTLLVGGTKVCNETCIHTGAMINHKVVVESNSIIGAMSFVIRRVKQGTLVMGNPAKKLEI